MTDEWNSGSTKPYEREYNNLGDPAGRYSSAVPLRRQCLGYGPLA
jgi:hypothetical protein